MEEPPAELHRAISGDLVAEDESDGALDGLLRVICFIMLVRSSGNPPVAVASW